MKVNRRILVVDDHKIFREGLSFVISHMDGFEVVAEAPNGHVFLEMISEVKPDIVLMDISMPGIDGITATHRAIEIYPDLRIIALTMFCDREYYNEMVKAGVWGFLLKESGMEELARSLRAVASGEKYFSQKLLHKIIVNSGMSQPLSKQSIRSKSKLSLMENEVLKLICQGYSIQQISDKLSLSVRAIEAYKGDLMNKTGSRNLVSLAVFAYKNKLVQN